MIDRFYRFYRNRCVAITGMTGFIGAHLKERLEMLGATVTGVRRNDLLDHPYWRRLLHTEKPDVIFHLAANNDLQSCLKNPASCFISNTVSTAVIIQEIKNADYDPMLVFTGTATQVGLTEHVVCSGDEIDRPTTTYDLSKITSEKLIEMYSAGITLRLCNVYGPGDPKRGFINRAIKQALQGEIIVYHQPEFSCIRDYVYINDVIYALLLSGLNPALRGLSFLVGSGSGFPLMTVAEKIKGVVEDVTGSSVVITKKPFPANTFPIDRRDFVSDPYVFDALAGWKPQVSLIDGIKETVRTCL